MKKLLNISRDRKSSNSPSASPTPSGARRLGDQQGLHLDRRRVFPRPSLSMSRSSVSLRSNLSSRSTESLANHDNDIHLNSSHNDTTAVSTNFEVDAGDTTFQSMASATTQTSSGIADNVLDDVEVATHSTSLNLHSPTQTPSGTHTRNHRKVESQTFSPTSSSTRHSHRFSMASARQSSLVDTVWDTTVFKASWINRITDDDSEGKLVRAELKGSQLTLYRVPAELSLVKNISIDPVAPIALDHVPSELSQTNEFMQSTSELLTPKQEKFDSDSLTAGTAFNNSETLQTQLTSASPLGTTTGQFSLLFPNKEKEINQASHLAPSILSTPPEEVELYYMSATCPHPLLTIDIQTGLIISGNLESICHTILFYPSDTLTDKLIEILPLMNPSFSLALAYLLKYVELFTEGADITSLEMEIMSRRVRRVLEIYLSKFTGLLLSNDVFDKCLKLMQMLKNNLPERTLAPPKLAQKDSPYLPNTGLNLSALERQLMLKKRSLQNLIRFEIEAPSEFNAFSATEFLTMGNNELFVHINRIDHDFLKLWNPHDDISFLCPNDYSIFNPLYFEPSKKYHYLGRLLSVHLFEDPVYSKTAECRAMILTKWIKLGQKLCDSGNMVSWLGISTVVCGLPVLRLTETWAFVDGNLIDEISKKWAPVVFEVMRNELFDTSEFKILVPRGIGSIYPKEDVIPYYRSGALPNSSDDTDNIKNYCCFADKLHTSLAKWDTYFRHVVNSVQESSMTTSHENDSRASLFLLAAIRENVHDEPVGDSKYMASSLCVEYSYTSTSDNWYQNSRSPLFLGSYPSILFIDVLQNYHIYNLKELIGGIGGSNDKILSLLGTDENESKKTRNAILKHIRDTFNVNCLDFHMMDESITFKTETNADAHSRPASVLFETAGTANSKKRMSLLSAKSLNVNDYINTYNSPALSQGSFHSTNVEVLVKAATVERLVDLLVLTSSLFGSKMKAEDIDRYSAKMGLTDSVLFEMDNGLFTETFFSTYRVLFSTIDLIDSLQKRFEGAKSAAVSIVSDNVTPFPCWTNEIETTDVINWKFVVQIQLGVLESALELIQNNYHHLFDNLATKDRFEKFLGVVDAEVVTTWPKIITDYQIVEGDETLAVFSKLNEVYKQLRTSFIRQSFTPSVGRQYVKFTTDINTYPADCAIPIEDSNVDDFIMRMEKEISRVVNLINAEDWISMFNIIQTLISKSDLAMFRYELQKDDIHDNLLQIGNVFHWIMTLKDQDGESVLGKLPESIRGIFQIYQKCRDFVLMQITDTSIDEDTRVSRMAMVLKMIKMARLEMENVKLFEDGLDRSPLVPSFLESILVNAMMLPVSRFYANAWIKAGKRHNAQAAVFNNLEEMLPESVEKLGTGLSVCPGWILSRIIEIVSFVPNMDIDNTGLVNFDKLRFVHTSVLRMLALPGAELEGLGMEFLSGLVPYNFNVQEVYQHAIQEGGPVSELFGSLLSEQRMLIKIEKQRLDLLMGIVPKDISTVVSEPSVPAAPEVKLVTEQPIRAVDKVRVSTPVTSVPTPDSTPGSSTPGNSHKFKFGLFKSRPFSISVPNYATEKRTVSFDELPAYPTRNGKVTHTLPLHHAKIFPTYRTPYSFTVTIPNGHHKTVEYTFQTHNAGECEEWVYLLNHCKRHWYQSKISKAPAPTTTFGMPLEHLARRDKSQVPVVIEKMMREIEMRGLEEVGLYRKSGSLSQVERIREAIDASGNLNMENGLVFDVHNITGCIKLFLRELPDPLIPAEAIEDVLRVRELAHSPDRFLLYAEIITKIPSVHYALLKRLTRHMALIEEWSPTNKMTSHNLATVMGGALVAGSRPEHLSATFGLMSFICEDWILNYDRVFCR